MSQSSTPIYRLLMNPGQHQHRIDFVLSSGANPIRSAELGDEETLRKVFERLGNTLNFS